MVVLVVGLVFIGASIGTWSEMVSVPFWEKFLEEATAIVWLPYSAETGAFSNHWWLRVEWRGKTVVWSRDTFIEDGALGTNIFGALPGT